MVLFGWSPATLAAQEGSEPEQQGGPPAAVLSASPVPEGQSIDLDGALTEAAWAAAVPITDFTQQEPVEGGTPTEDTEIRVVIDAGALYIGAKFYDDPDGILAHQRRRDQGLGTDDRFMWILDTFLDGRTGYFFEINPAGLMGDGLITGGGGGGGGGEVVWLRNQQGVGRESGKPGSSARMTVGPPRSAYPGAR